MKRHRSKTLSRFYLGSAMAVAVAAMGVVALAQSGGTITRTQVVGGQGGTCPVVLITLSRPMTLVSQGTEGATTLLVQLSGNGASGGAVSHETLPGFDLPNLGTVGLALDNGALGATLRLSFPVAPGDVTVRQAGPSSLIVAVTPAGASCGSTDKAPTLAGAPTEGGDARLTEARASLAAGNPARAIELLSALLSGPDAARMPEARELLGLAHERAGQPAHAKAEYLVYLADFPDGEGAARVRQRLLALETAEAEASAPLRQADGGAAAEPLPLPDALKGGEAQPRITSIPRKNDTFPPLGPQPVPHSMARGTGASGQGGAGEGPEDNFQATASAFYYRNQSSTLITELETNTTDQDQDLLQDALVFSLDMSDRRSVGGATLDWRLSGEHEVDLLDSAAGGLAISRAYGQLSWGEDGPRIALGRQSWSDDATLGRYDGLRLGVPVGENLRLNAVAGLPVRRTSDALFAGERQIMGLTAEILSLPASTKLSGFAFVTGLDGYTDRSEIGAEGSWTSKTQSVFGLLDYNLEFATVESAQLSWTRQLPQKATLGLVLTYSHSPTLGLSNALTGQGDISLADLNATYSLAEMKGLARDRTSENISASLTYARPLSADWTMSADLSAYVTGAMPASGGVDAVPGTGLQLYAGVQFTGSSILRPDDMLTLSARVADSETSRLVLAQGDWRINLAEGLRARSRLIVAHRSLAAGGGETFAIPSVALDYQLPGDTLLEFELGTRVSTQSTPDFAEETNEPWITAGITKQF